MSELWGDGEDVEFICLKSAKFLRFVGTIYAKRVWVEVRGFEPLTFSLRTRRSTN
jgi:hypothetical protein